MARVRIDDWTTPEALETIENWSRRGLTYEEIAGNIGITSRTLSNWIKKNFHIFHAIKKGREVLDYKLENALVKKALGYVDEHPEVTEEATERDGVVTKHKKKVTKVYPPDTGALIFLLKNRLKPYYQERPKTEDELESIRLENEMKRIELERLNTEREGARLSFNGIPASFIAPQFANLHFDIERGGHQEYILPGGRGSTKSSFISLELISLIEQNPEFHAMVCRYVGNTLKTSVFNQVMWAIERLGLSAEYKVSGNPLEITKLSTDQKIYFRGADDPGKLKSLQVPFGHIAVLWFEELDQFKGEESVRKIEQSVIRGGDEAYIFKSFNPPRSKSNWANIYINQPNPLALVTNSTYLDVPREWLGQPFFDRAEYQKQKNPAAYENEYLGVANGSGGNIFENVTVREITNDEISGFDRIVNGVDYGWYPDPFQFVRCHYDPAKERLYIFDEFRAFKTRNADTAEEVKKRIQPGEVVVCEREPKSVADFRAFGVNARPAVKGPGSREYGFKWLQSLSEIVVDPKRAPYTYRELIEYEYERDRMGEIIPGYPDANDHSLDAIRYACERFMKKGSFGVKAL